MEMVRASRRIRGKLARQVWWQEHLAVIISSLLLLCIVLGLLGPPLYVAYDTHSAPMQHELGRVVSYSGSNVLVRLKTTSVTYQTYGIQRPGATVDVFYQVGRSGRIYVASASPWNDVTSTGY